MARETKLEQGEKGGRNRLTPFQEARNKAHISRSFWNSLLRRIKELGLDKPRIRAIMRERKGWPGAKTLHAKCSDPMSDCRSRRRQLVLDCHAETREQSLFSLSSGSLASIWEESSSIPMNSSCVEGAKVFPEARGMSRSITTVRRWHSAVEHWDRGGGRAMKKSSRMCKTPVMLSLLRIIHSKTSESRLKRKWALRSPKGRTVSKK